MWNNKVFRAFSALFALTLLASACGSDASDTQTADNVADEAVSDETTSEDDAPSDMSDEEMSDGHESHDDDHGADHGDDPDAAKTIDVDPSLPIPEVAIILNETDDAGVFDLKVILANFTITPENVDGDPIDNEGHMHLLIDGEKVERFTDLERQITVPEGEHLVEVELNANNHLAYSIDGTPIRIGMTVTGAGEATSTEGGHSHEGANAAIEGGLTAGDADITISATYAGGDVALDGDDRVEVSVDDVVMITITSDVVEEAHVHGYDILAEAGPDSDGIILFTAKTPGRFEIEFEQSGTFIAELVVS